MFGFLGSLHDAGCFLGSMVLTLTGFSERKLLSMPCCLRKSVSFVVRPPRGPLPPDGLVPLEVLHLSAPIPVI